MFGKKKKEKIKDQAWLLLQDCGDIINSFTENTICSEYLNDNPAKALRGIFNLVGTCVYYVAGMNKAEVATQMVEYYADMVGRYDDDINPERITPEEAKRMINGYYQGAKGIAETLMDDGVTAISFIACDHAKAIFDNMSATPTEEDISIATALLVDFYGSTYSKYYG